MRKKRAKEGKNEQKQAHPISKLYSSESNLYNILKIISFIDSEWFHNRKLFFI